MPEGNRKDVAHLKRLTLPFPDKGTRRAGTGTRQTRLIHGPGRPRTDPGRLQRGTRGGRGAEVPPCQPDGQEQRGSADFGSERHQVECKKLQQPACRRKALQFQVEPQPRVGASVAYTFRPEAVGLHSVNVFVDKRHIPGSPFALKAVPTIASNAVVWGRGVCSKGPRVGDQLPIHVDNCHKPVAVTVHNKGGCLKRLYRRVIDHPKSQQTFRRPSNLESASCGHAGTQVLCLRAAGHRQSHRLHHLQRPAPGTESVQGRLRENFVLKLLIFRSTLRQKRTWRSAQLDPAWREASQTSRPSSTSTPKETPMFWVGFAFNS